MKTQTQEVKIQITVTPAQFAALQKTVGKRIEDLEAKIYKMQIEGFSDKRAYRRIEEEWNLMTQVEAKL